MICPICEKTPTEGTLHVHEGERVAIVNGRQIKLTRTEWRLLHVLVQKPGQYRSTEVIFDNLWGGDPDGGPSSVSSTISQLVSSLRSKIGIAEAISTNWGDGYALIARVEN